MTDHTEIPADVMETAKSIADGMDDCVKDFDWDEIQATIARAILAERERCANIAEGVGNYGDYKREELTKDYGQPRFDLMHDIVAAIRGV